MQIFVPMKHQSLRVTHPTSQEDRDVLVQEMRDVTEGHMSSIRDAFDFTDSGTLIANFDARRGETEFMLEVVLDRRLREHGFEIARRAAVEFDDIPETTIGSLFNLYMRGRTLVVIATEIADRGRHKYHTVRFVRVDPRFNFDDIH